MFQLYSIAFCIFLSSLPIAAKAADDADFNQAMQTIEQSPDKADQVIPLLRKSAERGNMEAAYNLGVALYTTVKTKEGWAEAIKWFKKAADAGDARARFNLATAYEDGTDKTIPPDVVTHYQHAAENGIVESMHRLGVIMTSGEYGQKDLTGGLSWLLLAEGYEDSDLKDDMQNALAITNGEEQKQARMLAGKRRTELEQNPDFLNNISL